MSCHAPDPRDFDDKADFTAQLVAFADQKSQNDYPLAGTVVAGDFNQDQYTSLDGVKGKPKNLGAFLAPSFKPFKDAGNSVDDDLTSSEYTKKTIDSAIEKKTAASIGCFVKD